MKEPKPPLDIEKNKLRQFIEEQETSIRNQLQEKVQTTLGEAQKILTKISESVDHLETAKLRNEKIDVRSRHIMEGNRAQYMKLVRAFVGQVKLPESLDETASAQDQFKHLLERIDKETNKSYFVLQDFFKDEIEETAKQIKRLSDALASMDSYSRSKRLKNILEAKNILEKKKEENKLEASRKKEAKSIGDDRKKLKKEKDELLLAIENLQKGSDWKQLNQDKQELQEQQTQLKIKKEAAMTLFYDIEKALRKYEHLSVDYHIIRKYLASPVDALVGDERLTIFPVFQKMKEAIVSNSLELKKNIAQKTMSALSKVSVDFLTTLRTEIARVQQRIRTLEDALSKSMIEEELETKKSRLEAINAECAHLKDKQEKLSKAGNADDHMEKIPEILSKVLKRDVRVV